MINYVAYRKFVTLQNGKRVMFRFLNEQDREASDPALPGGPGGGHPVSEAGRQGSETGQPWVDHLNYRKVLPLVAVDLETNRIIADATLHRGKHAAKHIGEVRIFVSPPYRNLGLGSLMLEELINLAKQENLQWLKAEIVADHKKVIKAFRAKGFEQKSHPGRLFYPQGRGDPRRDADDAPGGQARRRGILKI